MNSPIEQAIVNHIKIARAAIRLKHSIAADDELNALIEPLRLRLRAQAQDGYVEALTVPEILELASGGSDAASS